MFSYRRYGLETVLEFFFGSVLSSGPFRQCHQALINKLLKVEVSNWKFRRMERRGTQRRLFNTKPTLRYE